MGKIVEFKVIKRNFINTMMEAACKMSTVIWTMEVGCDSGIIGSMDEHILGHLTGIAKTAGWINETAWIEHDKKLLGTYDVVDDWGLNHVLHATPSSVSIFYTSMEKGTFIFNLE